MCGSVVSRRQPLLNITKTLSETDETRHYKDTEKQLTAFEGIHNETNRVSYKIH
jgi:cell fate (sporulation/competence/biofilm development) regulator YmcA (YheA/YmcA/DUF963 family)